MLTEIQREMEQAAIEAIGSRSTFIDINSSLFETLLFYKEPYNANLKYSNNENGRLSVELMLQGKEKIYENTGLCERKKKKTLVFNTAPQDKNVFKEMLPEVIRNGFDIYARTSDGYCHIKTIEDWEKITNLASAPKKVIQEELCKQNPNLIADHIESIGVLETWFLTNYYLDAPWFLNIEQYPNNSYFDVCNLSCCESDLRELSFAASSSVKTIYLIVQQWSDQEEHQRITSYVKRLKEKYGFDTKIWLLALDKIDIVRLQELIKAGCILEELTLANFDIAPDKILELPPSTSLKSLRLHKCINLTAESLTSLLRKYPNVTELKIQVDDLSNMQLHQLGSQNNIRSFSISGSQSHQSMQKEWSNLFELLQKFPMLERLELLDVTIDSPTLAKLRSLSQLKHFSLKSCNELSKCSKISFGNTTHEIANTFNTLTAAQVDEAESKDVTADTDALSCNPLDSQKHELSLDESFTEEPLRQTECPIIEVLQHCRNLETLELSEDLYLPKKYFSREGFPKLVKLNNNDLVKEDLTYPQTQTGVPSCTTNYAYKTDLNCDGKRGQHNVNNYFGKKDEIAILRMGIYKLNMNSHGISFQPIESPLQKIETKLPPISSVELKHDERIGRLLLPQGELILLPKYTPGDKLLEISCYKIDGTEYPYEIYYDESSKSYYAKADAECIFEYKILKAAATYDNLITMSKIRYFSLENNERAVALFEKIRELIVATESLEDLLTQKQEISMAVQMLCSTIGPACFFVVLAKYFNTFGTKLEDVHCFDEFKKVQEILKQKAGACRHRAAAAMFMLNLMFDDSDKAHIVRNECHDFLEVKIRDDWMRLDLGGVPSDLITADDEVAHDSHTTSTSEIRSANTTSRIVMPKISRPYIGRMTEEGASEKERAKGNSVKYKIKTIKKQNCTSKTQQKSKYFRVWEKESHAISNWECFLQRLTAANCNAGETKNLMFICETEEQIENLRQVIEQRLAANKRQYFNLDNAESVEDSMKLVHVDEDKTYELIDGPVAKFFAKNKSDFTPENPGSLLVNWEQLPTKDIVGYQSLYDRKRKIGNDKIHKNVITIGFITASKMQNLGEDFHSRASECQIINVASDCPKPEKIHAEASKKSLTVDLHYDNNFKAKLVGRISLQKEGCFFISTILQKCIDENITHLILQHVPKTRAFKQFCEEINIRKKIIINGEEKSLPEGFVITSNSSDLPYDLSAYNIKVNVVSSDCYEDFQVLNLSNKHFLFSGHEVSDGNIYTIAGLLEQHAKLHSNEPLKLLVTSNFTDAEWDEILMAAREYGCNLQLYACKNIDLPQQFTKIDCTASASAITTIATITNKQSGIVQTKNVDLVVKQLQEQLKHEKTNDFLVIPVTEETTYQDLIRYLDVISSETLQKKFTCREGAILNLLRQKNTIFLKGKISYELYQQLETLFIAKPYLPLHDRKEPLTSGKLFLVTDAEISMPEAIVDQRELIPKIHNPNIVRASANDSAENFMEKRRNVVMELLEKNKCLFIEGDTATGKTAFVRKELCERAQIFEGLEEDNILKWLKEGESENGAYSVLFIDEANLENAANKKWAFLAGSYGAPPHVLFKGILHPWPANCRVVLTGNPSNFAQRQLPNFIADYCEFLRFPQLPKDYLLKKVLGPTLACDSLQASELTNILNLVYFFYDIAKKVIGEKVTPRLLQKMGLNIAASASYDLKSVTAICLKTIEAFLQSANITDDKELFYKKLETELLQQKVPLSERLSIFLCEIANEEQNSLRRFNAYEKNHKQTEKVFTATECHKAAISSIENALALRKLRMKNESLHTLGTRGYLFAGPSGIGKSELLSHYLKYAKTEEGNKALEPDTTISQITANNDLDNIASIITKAAKEGGIVIIDEINLLPAGFIEGILNNLLQGASNNFKVHPGFLVFATQNPSDHDGRQVQSCAFRDRFEITEMQNYKPGELSEVLETKGIRDSKIREEFVADYDAALEEAETTQKFPFPTPRDLFGSKIELMKLKQQSPLVAASCSQFMAQQDCVQQGIFQRAAF